MPPSQDDCAGSAPADAMSVKLLAPSRARICRGKDSSGPPAYCVTSKTCMPFPKVATRCKTSAPRAMSTSNTTRGCASLGIQNEARRRTERSQRPLRQVVTESSRYERQNKISFARGTKCSKFMDKDRSNREPEDRQSRETATNSSSV